MKKQDLIEHFGNVRLVAEAVGCTPGAVSQWPEDISIPRQCHIEILTGGVLRAAVANRGKFRRSKAVEAA